MPICPGIQATFFFGEFSFTSVVYSARFERELLNLVAMLPYDGWWPRRRPLSHSLVHSAPDSLPSSKFVRLYGVPMDDIHNMSESFALRRYVQHHRLQPVHSRPRIQYWRLQRLGSATSASSTSTTSVISRYAWLHRRQTSAAQHRQRPTTQDCVGWADFSLWPFRSQGSATAAASAVGINIYLALSRRCQSVRRIFRSVADVQSSTSPAHVDATSVSSLLQPTDQADACVCPRSCRHSPPCSVGFRHSSRHSVNKRRFHRVVRRRIRLQRHRGNLAWLPCVSSSPPHWLRF